jgi:hypothetical protein
MFKRPFNGKTLKLMLAAAVLITGLVAAGASGPRHAAAIDDNPGGPDPTDPTGTPTATVPPKPKYKVELSFSHVKLDNRDDGWEDLWFGGDHHLELYGRVRAWSGAGYLDRMFGTNWYGNNPGDCPGDGVEWNKAGPQSKCLRGYGLFDLGVSLNGGSFAALPMCSVDAATKKCASAFAQNKHTWIIELSPDQEVNWTVEVKDEDSLSDDDIACAVSGKFGKFSEAELKPAGGFWSQTKTQPANGTASCEVKVNLKRVP